MRLLISFFSLLYFNLIFSSDVIYVPQVELDLQKGKIRNYGRASLFLPLSQSGSSLPFINVFGLSESLGATEGNVGLGYR